MFIVIILLLILAFILIKYNNDKAYIYFNDIEYYTQLILNRNSKLLNNNLINNTNKNNRILIITFDNRPNIEYIKLHNKNLQDYCNKWGYEYQYYNTCEYNVYWCKIYLVLQLLNTNKYDYIMWLDSDTIIKNPNIELNSIINNYHSDIFIGHDKNNYLTILNAGVFIIKNSDIGKTFLKDCIKSFNKKKCLETNLGKLNGMWAGICYEQGIMNLLIINKYYNHTTLLPDYLINNSYECKNEVFIMHLYGATEQERKNCFI